MATSKDCGCRNHLGAKKQMHKTRDRALEAVLRRHLRHGPHEIYPCPKKEGVWHIRSVNRATSGPAAAGSTASGRRQHSDT